MKALVVYDSATGNTEKIAQAIGEAIEGEVKVLRAGEVNPADLKSLDVLIVGCPTYGGRPTPVMREFLSKVSRGDISGIKVATFDTRMAAKFVKIFGFAAGRIAKSLKGKGANVIGTAEGFIVIGGKGPLKDGELERATAWAKGIVESKQ
ncbi:flavodoxin family protein [Chloroflexota bacterium]